jgi:uncharacterized protein YcbK (DUF882 family)
MSIVEEIEDNNWGIEIEDSELKLKYMELQFKKKELELQERNAKLNRDLEKFKIVTTGVVVTLVTSIISWQIQNQQVEIERLSREQEYIKTFSEQALQADLRSRFAFADYLSTIAHSKSSRNRWSAYKKRVQLAITVEEGKEKEINDLRDQIAILSRAPGKNADEIEALEKIIHEKEIELKSFQDAQTVEVSTSGFVFAYNLDSSIIEGGRFLWRDAVIRMNHESIPTSQVAVDNIIKAATFLEEVEDFLGQPVEVRSWYRSPEHNARVGGSSNSRHLAGDAVAITVGGMSVEEAYEKLDPWWGDRGGLAANIRTNTVHIDGRGYRARWNYD